MAENYWPEKYLPVISSQAFNTTKTRSFLYDEGDLDLSYYQYKTSFALTLAAEQLLDQQSENLVLCKFELYNLNEIGGNCRVRDLNLSFDDGKIKANIWRDQRDSLYIYASADRRNRDWDVEFTLEFEGFSDFYPNITFASLMLDQYRQFSPPDIPGKVLDIKSYSVNLNVFEREFKMNFEFADDLKIGDRVFFWILLSPTSYLNVSTVSSSFLDQGNPTIQRYNFSFTLNGTITNIPDEFAIRFPNLDSFYIPNQGNGENLVWSFMASYIGNNYAQINNSEVTLAPSHLNPANLNPKTWIIAISISIPFSILLGIFVYYLRRRYMDRKYANRRSNASTIEAEYDDDSYTLHSQSTISTTPSNITFS
jgi:hypothetical protein